MSIMVGTGRGAEVGVLLRNAEALEVMERVDTVVVDKTGTLTEGKPALTTVVPEPPIDEATLLRLVASLEKVSEHPLAEAIVRGAEERAVQTGPVTHFRSVTGKGVVGTVDGRTVAIGNAAMLTELGATVTATERADALRRNGETVMFVAVDGAYAGLVGVADRVKATTVEAIRALHDEGLRIVMLTGDSRVTAEAVARSVGIDVVEAEVLPEQKAAVVKRLQAEGRKVAMAGDGINDAPALAQADVGIAMGTGTDVAMESAGVTLVQGDLRGLVRAQTAEPGDDAQHPPESVLCLRLQRTRRAGRGRGPVSRVRAAAEPDDCQRRHDLQFGVGDRQCVAPEAGGAVSLPRTAAVGSWSV